jgi:hypothetical protein
MLCLPYIFLYSNAWPRSQRPIPSAGNGTFQQQYQLKTTYFRRGGPILFFQSVEIPLECSEGTILWDWAHEMGTIVAALEHRYFGLGLPFGFNASTATPSEYVYLTMNNTGLDSVNFVHWIKENIFGATNSKVIAMGGWCTSVCVTRSPLKFQDPTAGS